jgi:hypothetical protein
MDACRESLPFAQTARISGDGSILDSAELLEFPLDILGSDIKEEVADVDLLAGDDLARGHGGSSTAITPISTTVATSVSTVTAGTTVASVATTIAAVSATVTTSVVVIARPLLSLVGISRVALRRGRVRRIAAHGGALLADGLRWSLGSLITVRPSQHRIRQRALNLRSGHKRRRGRDGAGSRDERGAWGGGGDGSESRATNGLPGSIRVS